MQQRYFFSGGLSVLRFETDNLKKKKNYIESRKIYKKE